MHFVGQRISRASMTETPFSHTPRPYAYPCVPSGNEHGTFIPNTRNERTARTRTAATRNVSSVVCEPYHRTLVRHF
eukprot:1605862-Prymnesium_polylepis.1